MFTVYDIDGNTETVSYAVDAQELVKTDPRWIGFHETDEREAEKIHVNMNTRQPIKQRSNSESIEDIVKKLERRGIKVLSNLNGQYKKVSLVCNKCLYKFTTDIGSNTVCPRCNGRMEKGVIKLKYSDNKRIERTEFRNSNCINSNSVFDICEYNIVNDIKLERKNDFLTIVATAETVKKDIKRWGLHGDLMAVNDAAFYLPNYQHAVSIHGQILPMIKSYKREFRNYEDNQFVTHTSHYADVGLLLDNQLNADVIWKIRPIYRSSGMLAIYIGIAMGYKSILVHGVTLDERDHYYDLKPSHIKRNFTRLNNLAENGGAIDLIRGCNVRASSGKFSEQIGKPTKEWISQKI